MTPACDREPGRGAATWGEAIGKGGAVKLVVLLGLLVWLYWGHFYRLYVYWLQPDWSHGFLVLPFCLYLVHLRKEEILRGEIRGSLWGLVLLLMAVGGYLFSVIYKYGYPQQLSILPMLAGLVLLMCGWRVLWLTLFPICFFFLALPPPERLYREIVQPLQNTGAAVAQAVLGTFPNVLEIERSGFNIGYFMADGTDSTFQVAGACSGMRSLMAFAFIGLAMAYWAPRATWQRVAMAVAVVPVALFCNVLRVIVTGSLKMYGHDDWATGTPHTVLGLLMFALGILIYKGFLWVMDHLFEDVAETNDGGAAQPAG